VEWSGWDALALCAKAVTYAATLGAAGAIFFLGYNGPLLKESRRGPIRRLIATLVVVSAIAGCARILLLAGSMSGDLSGMFDASLARMILNGGEGRATGLRLAGLALCAAGLSTTARAQIYSLTGAVIAATSFAWVGHVHALPGLLPSLVLSLHLLGASFWLGALLPLLIVAHGADSEIAAVAARFGKLALAVVGLLLVAGAGILWTLINDASAFWSSPYGEMMAIKLLAVALMLSMAAANKLYLTPRLLKREPRAT
jgi:putative copper export protein